MKLISKAAARATIDVPSTQELTSRKNSASSMIRISINSEELQPSNKRRKISGSTAVSGCLANPIKKEESAKRRRKNIRCGKKVSKSESQKK